MINIYSITPKIALVIDAENTQLQYIEEILKLSAYIGDLVVISAYGDWSKRNIASYKTDLEALNIDCIQVKNTGENSSDFGLSIGIGEIFPRYANDGSPDMLILVSGDGDFMQVCEYIRERDKRLIIIGGKHQTSPELKNYCENLYYLEDLQQELQKLEQQYPIHPIILRQVFGHLEMMFAVNFENPYGGLTYDEVEKELLEKFSNSPLNLGNYQLSEYLEFLGEKFEKRGDRIIINPHFLRRMALSMAYTDAKQDSDSVSLALFGNFLRESSNKFSPDFYTTYFRGKKLSEWLAIYHEYFEIKGNYVTRR